MNSNGHIICVDTTSTMHQLHLVDNDGRRTDIYIDLTNSNILEALADKKGIASYTSSSNIDDFFKVFLFASDNSNVEWALHRGQDNSYTIGTSHNEKGVAAYSVLRGIDKFPLASVHSHPDVVTHKKERESMGYDEGWVQYANDRQKVYWGVVPKYNYVYFPISKTLYNVESDNPRYVKHINTFKDFYFGTLNYR